MNTHNKEIEFSRIMYTPGPCYHSKAGNNADQWMIIDNTGRTIGLSYHGEGNAQLWAASNEMLETLRFYAKRENWKDKETGIGTYPGDAVDFGARARAAIDALNDLISG